MGTDQTTSSNPTIRVRQTDQTCDAAWLRRRDFTSALGLCHFEHPDEQQRHALIRDVAYSLAERRGFAPGHELQDWLAAESEVNHWFQGEQFFGT